MPRKVSSSARWRPRESAYLFYPTSTIGSRWTWTREASGVRRKPAERGFGAVDGADRFPPPHLLLPVKGQTQTSMS